MDTTTREDSAAQQTQRELVDEAVKHPGVAEAIGAYLAVERYARVARAPAVTFGYATGGNVTEPTGSRS